MTKNEVNIDKLIEEHYIVPESVFDRKRTKTSHFMINTIFPTNTSITSTEYFVNAFLDDEDVKHVFIRPIFVLFKMNKNDTKWMSTMAPRLRAKPEFVLEYFCGTDPKTKKHLMMMVFKVPVKWGKEYTNFKAGKYSLMSEEYKKMFNRYTHDEKAQPIESIIWKVLYKHIDLREHLQDWIGRGSNDYQFTEEDELWGIPTSQYEHYRWKQPSMTEENLVSV